MPYATLADLVAQYGERVLRDATDRAEASTGTIDADAVARAIASADALIDGYLKARYALPLVTTPALVNELSMTIALYKLHPEVTAEKVRRDYEDALKLLDRIAAGTIRLDVAGAEPQASGTGGARITDREPQLTQEKLRGWI